MIDGLIMAIQFLTRIPVNIPVKFDRGTSSKAAFFYPFVGIIIGAVSSVIYYAALILGKDSASVFAVLSLVIVTGGLHIDGLSDTCDGFFSARDKNKIMEIMKDSRCGTFGVIAVVLDLLLKYVLLSNIKHSMVYVLIFSCANGRLMATMLMSYTRNARSDGLGAMFSNKDTRKYFLISLIIYTFIICMVNYLYLIPLAASFLSTMLIVYKSNKTIGGLTGDVYGANIEISEIVSFLAFQVLQIWI